MDKLLFYIIYMYDSVYRQMGGVRRRYYGLVLNMQSCSWIFLVLTLANIDGFI